MQPCFNLIDEKWICLMREDGTTASYSLRETLLNAQNYRALAGESPTQDFALLRVLLAVLYAALFGEEEPETPDEALDQWESLWRRGSFPEDEINGYLGRWYERFYLFHEERPFMQVPCGKDGLTMENAAKKSKLENTAAKPESGFQTAAKLNATIFESNHKEKLFNNAVGNDKYSLAFPEAARWLIHVIGFDDGGLKHYYKKNTAQNHVDERAKCSVSWLGSISPLFAEGRNLFETLLLNLILLKDGQMDEDSLWDNPMPIWEYEQVDLAECKGAVIPDNPAELYTFPHRRIMLVRKDDRVIGFLRYVGEGFSPEGAANEQMTIWTVAKKDAAASPHPRKSRMPTQMWREFSAITSVGDGGFVPGIVRWIALLEDRCHILPQGICTFHYVKALYDGSHSSSMTEIIEDRLSFSVGLLSEAGRAWSQLLQQELETMGKLAWQLGVLAHNLFEAEGGQARKGGQAKKGGQARDNKNNLTPTAAAVTREAEEQFFFAMDKPFREWLQEICADDNSKQRDERLRAIRDTAREVVRRCGDEMIRQVSPAAYSKRANTENASHITAPEAWANFLRKVNNLLPPDVKENRRVPKPQDTLSEKPDD